jgi:hypothetical protein
MNRRKYVGGMNINALREKRSSMRLGREESFEGMGSKSYNNVKAYQAGLQEGIKVATRLIRETPGRSRGEWSGGRILRKRTLRHKRTRKNKSRRH